MNRFGNNGDGLTSAQYLRKQHYQSVLRKREPEDHDANGNVIPCTFCHYNQNPTTSECDPCTQNDTTTCKTNPNYLQCVAERQCVDGRSYVRLTFDGNPLFFPADAIAKPWSPDSTAQISGNYDP